MSPIGIVMIVASCIAVICVVVTVVRYKKKNKSCDSNCGSCPHARECKEKLEAAQRKIDEQNKK